MPRRNAERLRRLRAVVHQLVLRDELEYGYQAKLAEHFRLSRQRVHQIVIEERMLRAAATNGGSQSVRPNAVADVASRPNVMAPPAIPNTIQRGP